MTNTIALTGHSSGSSPKSRWVPLQAIAQTVLWPNRWLATAWLLSIGLYLIGLIMQAGLPLIVGVVMFLSLHLSIPIQINGLSHRKSWLLLPDFKPMVLSLLLILLGMWLVILSILVLLTPDLSWLLLPYGALTFSLVMLPTVYQRHMWPLLAELLLLVTLMVQPVSKAWLASHGSAAWFVWVMVAFTIGIWWWMAARWLHPAQRERTEVKRTSLFALYGIDIPWLLRLTRQSVSLPGTLLLGDGDRWSASVVRALWATWLAPAIFFLTDLIFSNSKEPTAKLWTEQTFLVLLTLAPLFTLAAQQQKSTQRLGRCWLFLAGDRQQMFGFAERLFYREFVAYLAMTLLLMLVLVPQPMILPLLCYGASASLLLCYLIFALAGRSFWWNVSANLSLLIALMVGMNSLWMSPQLIYLTSLAFLLPLYPLRRYGIGYWQQLDYSQLKPRQLI